MGRKTGCPECGGTMSHTFKGPAANYCPTLEEWNRERMRERYWALTGVEFNALMLKRRRTKALTRMADRRRRKGA